MLRYINKFACALSICAAFALTATSTQAGTIIKLNLGGTGPDIELAGGVLSTVNDLNAGTTGDQDTAILFDDFLNGNPDINTSTASVTIDGLALSGPAVVVGPFVAQGFAGGTISIYSPTNILLLQGTLGNSTLSGNIGPPPNGSVFTTTFADVTGGTLDPQIANNTLTVQMTLSNINGGAGLSAGVFVDPFVADSAVTLDADPVPEPTAGLLALVGVVLTAVANKRRR
jgi:hypothetical protein